MEVEGVKKSRKRVSTTHGEGSEERKKRTVPAGYTPFKQIEIPDSWKDEHQTMQESVWAAVASCQYDDPQKKERLCTAVMEALSGQKTMKAAASSHEVPFTTLQTYFHRSRALMAKAMNERDNEVPTPIQVPVSLNLSSTTSKPQGPSVSAKKTERLDTVLGVIMNAKIGNLHTDEGKSPSPEVSAPTGSNKRKPKSVHRVVNNPTCDAGVDDENLNEVPALDETNLAFMQTLQQLGLDVSALREPGTAIVVENNDFSEMAKLKTDEEVRGVIDYVVGFSIVEEETKARLKLVLFDLYRKKLPLEAACIKHQLSETFCSGYLEVVENILKRSAGLPEDGLALLASLDLGDGLPRCQKRIPWAETDSGESSRQSLSSSSKTDDVSEKPGSSKCDSKKQMEKDNYLVGPPLDPTDSKRLSLIEECVERVCKPSLYPLCQKDLLQKAVGMVIRGEYTINAAANMTQLPSSTLHPYVHRARKALGTLLPPQASGPTLWNSTKKIHEFSDQPSVSDTADEEISNGCLDLEEMDKVITNLVKNSLYDESGRQKIYEATLMVLTENVSTTDAAKQYGLPASTVQPYVQRARAALSQPTHSNKFSRKVENSHRDRTFLQQSADVASDEEVKNVVNKVLANCSSNNSRREKLYAAVFLAVSGKLTIKDSCQQKGLPASTVHPYVSKARHMLGARCPAPKMISSQHSGPSSSNAKSPSPPSQPKPVKAESDNSDEDECLSRSLRGVAKMLCDTKFDRVSPQDFCGSREDLKTRIDKILQHYKYKGDRENMSEAIMKVFLETKTVSEVCNSNGLAPTTLSTYVRLVKAYVKTEKMLEKDTTSLGDYTGSPPPRKPKTVRDLFHDEVLAKTPAELLEPKDFHLEYDQLEDSSVKARSDDRKEEHVVPQNSGEDTKNQLENSKDHSGIKKLTTNVEVKKEVAEDEEDGSKKLKKNLDIMTLHTDAVIKSNERCISFIISYLIEHQYRRCEEAQEKMRTCLEYVLLDGLSVAETLKIHKGPAHSVLEVYLGRCRDAYKCVTVEYPNFLAEVVRTVKKASIPSPVAEKGTKGTATARGSRKGNSSQAATRAVPVATRASRRLQQTRIHSEEGQSDSHATESKNTASSSTSYLKSIFSDAILKPITSYIKKLDAVNFPIETALIIGLAKVVYGELPEQHQQELSDAQWSDWAADYKKQHPEFDD